MGKCYTYQRILTTDGTDFAGHTVAKKGGNWYPLGRTILTNVKSVFTLLRVPVGYVHCGVVAEYYLWWRSGVICRASCQRWGSWNLPRLCLRDGSLTLMNVASLTFLVMPHASLPKMVKLSTMMQCPEMLLILGCGRGPCSVPEAIPKRSFMIPQ